MDGLYLTSFDAKRIRINKKVKEFYESLTLYNETNETKIEEPVNVSELVEEKYEDKKDTSEEEETKKNIKVIKL